MKNKKLIIFALGIFLPLQGLSFLAKKSLPSAGIKNSGLTVSGLSSGAFFAIQFAVAHSEKVQGVASFAGGIYNCADGELLRASAVCMKEPQMIETHKIIEELKKNSHAGLVDDVENIAKQKIYIYQGQKDSVLHPPAADKLTEFYTSFHASVTKRLDIAGGHGFPSEQASAACEANQKPWLNNCLFDGAGELLNLFYGPLRNPVPMKRQNLIAFDQSEFETADSGMAEEGFIYLPTECQVKGAQCHLHIAFHGCQQNPATVGDQFMVQAGYNSWAESNKIIILYPAVAASKKNPQGCWDWYGYSGKDYALKSGRQIMSIHKMLARLKQQP